MLSLCQVISSDGDILLIFVLVTGPATRGRSSLCCLDSAVLVAGDVAAAPSNFRRPAIGNIGAMCQIEDKISLFSNVAGKRVDNTYKV